MKSEKSRSLLEEENALANIYATHLIFVFTFQDTIQLCKKLLFQCIKIVNYVAEDDNIDKFVKSGELAKIVECKLIGAALSKMDMQKDENRVMFKEQ